MADIYKKAAQQGLTFNTNRGVLTVTQLFGLGISDLDALAVRLQEEYKNSGGKSFIATDDNKDKTIKLKFDIALDVLETKVAAADKASKVAETRAHNKKILELIASKQDESLAGMSIEDLEKQLK